jgi:hypothetical protein
MNCIYDSKRSGVQEIVEEYDIQFLVFIQPSICPARM